MTKIQMIDYDENGEMLPIDEGLLRRAARTLHGFDFEAGWYHVARINGNDDARFDARYFDFFRQLRIAERTLPIQRLFGRVMVDDGRNRSELYVYAVLDKVEDRRPLRKRGIRPGAGYTPRSQYSQTSPLQHSPL